MDNPKQFTAIEWCAGYGGIHLGLKRAIPNLRVIAYGEIEAFACANLVSKMEAGLMDSAPIWSDLKTFPAQEFRDRVDLLVAGYPCQPFSAAGKRLGTEDPRHLWPHIAGSIRVIRPRLCFFENVEGHISLGLREVIGELEEIGYQTAWGIFSAREVGAPHQRKRVFILANLKCAGLERLYNWHTPSEQTEFVGADSRASCQRSAWEGCELADDTGERLSLSYGQRNEPEGQRDAEFECCGHNAWPSRPGEPQHGWEPPRVVDSTSARQQAQRSESNGKRQEGFACESSELGNADHGRLASGLNARSGTEADRGGQSDIEQADGSAMGNAESEQSSSRDHRGQQGSLGEQEQVQLGGGDCGALRESNRQAQPSLGGNPDGSSDWMDYAELYTTCDNRTDELRLLGNGVVPATAERAFRTLLTELLTPQKNDN